MRKIKLFIIVVAIAFCSQTKAQDIHFSQYEAAPLLLNPANVGAFDGDYRVGLIYRNQWRSFTTPFITYSGFLGKRFKAKFLKDDAIGVGIVLFNDNSGTANFTTQSAGISIAYHKMLADGIHEVSIGVEPMYVQKSYSYANLNFHNQYESVFYNEDISSGETFSSEKFSYPDYHIGARWKYKLNDKITTNLGLSMFNLSKPRETFFNNADNRLGSRFGISGGAVYQYDEKTQIIPGFFYEGQSKAYEFLIGAGVSRDIVKTPISRIAPSIGVYYRSADAILIVPGLLYNNYKFGLSYDVNVSSLKKSSKMRGAIEFSIIYILRTNTQLEIKKSIPCKRL